MTDQEYMLLAINLAKSTIGQTSPNPSVGALIVKNGKIISYGLHLKAGEAHAEVNAIKSTNMCDIVNADLYITLEPCCHTGKTKPCTELIIKNKFKRVIVATIDPNPLVAGKGVKKLRDAGIEVITGVMEKEAIELNKIFFHYITKKTPYITLKVGMSLDSKIATSSRESKWITNNTARKDSHNYRHTHDAILVGVNTIITDNPSLTTQLENGGKNPIRIILDTNLRTPIESIVVNDNLSKTIIITSNQVSPKDKLPFEQKNIEILSLKSSKINITDALKILREKSITSILVEGGQTIHNSFLQEKIFNQIVVYIAPMLIGGKSSINFFAGKGFSKLSQAIKLKIKETTMLGDNIKIVAEQDTLCIKNI